MEQSYQCTKNTADLKVYPSTDISSTNGALKTFRKSYCDNGKLMGKLLMESKSSKKEPANKNGTASRSLLGAHELERIRRTDPRMAREIEKHLPTPPPTRNPTRHPTRHPTGHPTPDPTPVPRPLNEVCDSDSKAYQCDDTMQSQSSSHRVRKSIQYSHDACMIHVSLFRVEETHATNMIGGV